MVQESKCHVVLPIIRTSVSTHSIGGVKQAGLDRAYQVGMVPLLSDFSCKFPHNALLFFMRDQKLFTMNSHKYLT